MEADRHPAHANQRISLCWGVDVYIHGSQAAIDCNDLVCKATQFKPFTKQSKWEADKSGGWTSAEAELRHSLSKKINLAFSH
jgi:hypothetical protein